MSIMLFLFLFGYGVLIMTNFILPAFADYNSRVSGVIGFLALWSWLFVFVLSVADVCVTLTR